MPYQADAGQQTAFLIDTLVPLLAQAEAGEAVVYFVDAAHPTHNTHATHVWTETGKERPLLTVSGRERVNLNAALNAQCPTQVNLDETDCINAQSTQRLYENCSPSTCKGRCTLCATTPATTKVRLWLNG